MTELSSIAYQPKPEPAIDPNDHSPRLRLGRLKAPTHDSRWKMFVSNIKEFMTERPVKIKGAKPTPFDNPGFGDSFKDNLSEFWKPGVRGNVNSELLVDWDENFGGFWQNIKDWLNPPKMAPWKGTSKPIAVKDIWSKDTQFSRVQAMSLAIHVLVIVLIVLPLWHELFSPAVTNAKSNVDVTLVSPYLPKLPAGAKPAGGGGGGGAHELLPASHGKAPKFAMEQIAKPAVVVPQHAAIQVPPTVLGNPELNLRQQDAKNWGDPLAKVLNDSSGSGSGGGIGSGSGGGIGSGNGGGVGPGEGYGTGGGTPTAGTGGYGSPVCLYCPQAEYSDEAVKAKYQGTVLLVATITPDGKATDIQVVKGMGLGLDEKAIAAVRTWRFTPARGPDGRPAAVRQTIEVQFHLY
ncbi:MAG: energy transducer TonB [Candidatus Acidiferrales bacterium]